MDLCFNPNLAKFDKKKEDLSQTEVRSSLRPRRKIGKSTLERPLVQMSYMICHIRGRYASINGRYAPVSG